MRVVSLVPSATETLVALGVEPVGCTRFCQQQGIAEVGGTKNPDLDAVAALNPHLVVVNDEENRVEDALALERLGFDVHDMSPRSVEGVGPAVVALAQAVGVEAPTHFHAGSWEGWLAGWRAAAPPPVGAFVAVWPKPWMTLNRDTYGSSLLGLLGVANVYGDAAERYPEVTVEEVAARGPVLVLLPSEPYPFRERHVETVVRRFPDARVALVDGQDLFWWGIRTPHAVARLSEALGALR